MVDNDRKCPEAATVGRKEEVCVPARVGGGEQRQAAHGQGSALTPPKLLHPPGAGSSSCLHQLPGLPGRVTQGQML